MLLRLLGLIWRYSLFSLIRSASYAYERRKEGEGGCLSLLYTRRVYYWKIASVHQAAQTGADTTAALLWPPIDRRKSMPQSTRKRETRKEGEGKREVGPYTREAVPARRVVEASAREIFLPTWILRASATAEVLPGLAHMSPCRSQGAPWLVEEHACADGVVNRKPRAARTKTDKNNKSAEIRWRHAKIVTIKETSSWRVGTTAVPRYCPCLIVLALLFSLGILVAAKEGPRHRHRRLQCRKTLQTHD